MSFVEGHLAIVWNRPEKKGSGKDGKNLAGIAQWIERGPAKQRVAGLIPSQGTCLGCGSGPQ